MVNELKTISLFTGCGGLDLGFEAAGFSIILASDIMPEACETLRRNKKGLLIFGPPDYSGNIRDLNIQIISKNLGLKQGSVDLMIGGPPCQSFSVAAAQRFLKEDNKFKRKGFKCPTHGNLIFEYLRLIQEVQPRVFLIENVPGIVGIDGGKTLNNLKNTFESIGYFMNEPILVEAADYGVPQFRKRVFIVGSKEKKIFTMPPGEYGDDLLFRKPFRTVCQALANIPSTVPNAETRQHKISTIIRYKNLAFGKREHLGRVDRLDPLKPSKTVIAGGSRGGGRSHLHPYIARTLSVRECARLQTFPDDYAIYGKIGRQFTQVGNAVPPLLAEHIAREIGKTFFSKSYHNKKLHLEHDYLPMEKTKLIIKKQSLEISRDLCYNDVLVGKRRECELVTV
jgi:DNA (cytosine-5)-methyltransferase 1